jgi:hypothetical protein
MGCGLSRSIPPTQLIAVAISPTHRPPSPRMRGEGRDEGAAPPGSESRQGPLTRRTSRGRPLPAWRGEVKSRSRSRDAAASESCCWRLAKWKNRHSLFRHSQIPPRREAERRQAHPAMIRASGRGSGLLRKPARLSALHRGSWLGDRTPPLSLGPRFLDHRVQTGFHPLRASAASSSQTGRSAGRAGPQGRPGAVCETARGRRTRSAIRIASGMHPS